MGPRVDRGSENRQDLCCCRGAPLKVANSLAPVSAKAQSKAIRREIAEHSVGGAEFDELVENEFNRSPRLLIRFLNKLARR
jgi:hypothetical protein